MSIYVQAYASETSCPTEYAILTNNFAPSHQAIKCSALVYADYRVRAVTGVIQACQFTRRAVGLMCFFTAQIIRMKESLKEAQAAP